MLIHLHDTLIRLKNASVAGNPATSVRRTFFTYQLLEHMLQYGFIGGYAINSSYTFLASLRYFQSAPSINNITIYSRPSQRIFLSHTQLKQRFRGFTGLVLVNTNFTRPVTYPRPIMGRSNLFVSTTRFSGLIDFKSIQNEKIGGELICAIS